MAGLIAALMKRKAPATPFDPALEGIGGDTSGSGPANQSGFPGSTSQTRTFNDGSPRSVKIRADTNSGFDQGFEGESVTQAGRHYGEGWQNPRDTPDVATPRPRTVGSLRRNPQEWFGGLPLRTDAVSPANDIVGGNPLMRAQDVGGHSTYDTETPRTSRQPDISGGVPGSQNVRNQIALRWKNPPGTAHTYQSASRPDQAPRNPGGQATDGNVHPERVRTEVTVPNRFVWNQGGVQTWSVQRQMPYGSGERGDGARGADLNGTRYYAEGPPVNVNGGMGDYGIRRLRGDKTRRPVSFSEPAPWTAQFYDTTASVGTTDSPGPGGQSPDLIYVSPDPGRGGINATGR